ncbi:hypothetical protein LK07_27520 [Streptomyces pluripotens]|uniref:BMP family ABC transporter substrate-binding protein n=1 Tax=Streptomyces pluripotens TaxID=1355015 RepID=A0A221P4R9_9ACTN|nr:MULTISPECIES: hypothetical protein [Streptomyces]ARP72902.1 hypothetical protein LK06_026365 [Streptomyces pluripotens]ASN27152.1 hypothetical protein LK07_27520 [Streptomyces pluripotens]KIE28885.1 hypothetical protein LK08_00395 [Streptomyces sp. MUSC 125]MCH0559900.1 hypothetical protein [Streptomyces sp. MUM 16J]
MRTEYRQLLLRYVLPAVLLGAVAAAVLVLLPDSGNTTSTQAPAAQNISGRPRVCLLQTDTHSTSDRTTEQQVWSALQRVTPSGRVNLQRLSAGSATGRQLAPYLNSLVARHCRLIIAVGRPLAEPVKHNSAQHPHQRYALVAAATGTRRVAAIPPTSSGLDKQLAAVLTDVVPM